MAIKTLPPAVNNPPDPSAPRQGQDDISKLIGKAVRQAERQSNPPDPQAGVVKLADGTSIPLEDLPPSERIATVDLTQQPLDDLGQLILDADRDAKRREEAQRVENQGPQPQGGRFTEAYNPETGLYDVYDLDNPAVAMTTGLTEEQAAATAQDLARAGTSSTVLQNSGVAYGADGFLRPGWTLDENRDPVFIGGDHIEPRGRAFSNVIGGAVAPAGEPPDDYFSSRTPNINTQRQRAGDWRVRLQLAPGSNYFYNKRSSPHHGIMAPLVPTNGVIFPYTPQMSVQYVADYTSVDLVHTNYRAYFYKGSRVPEVSITAPFTAQDTKEADYLLAVIHFFRSCTKMFYGQDNLRGTPPPMVFLTGLGTFQFANHPCVISQFQYNLPQDVDYIRARDKQFSSAGVNTNAGLGYRRPLVDSASPSFTLSGVWARLTGAKLPVGAVYENQNRISDLGVGEPTYVPTKIDITLTLLPMQSRAQVSREFSLADYASGDLLRRGFW